ncbi:hypothetical protein GQ54DRAFT_53105 [Martensiomyces pterosporus]|nr:hypothetical protein GQ54DRAFT_53105 [Martensiomyces pterosporus]
MSKASFFRHSSLCMLCFLHRFLHLFPPTLTLFRSYLRFLPLTPISLSLAGSEHSAFTLHKRLCRSKGPSRTANRHTLACSSTLYLVFATTLFAIQPRLTPLAGDSCCFCITQLTNRPSCTPRGSPQPLQPSLRKANK